MVKSVREMFVYGTLMSGERNHMYFENSIINIEDAKVTGTVYHIEKQRCPSIELGRGECVGELITYKDPTGEITDQIVAMEQEFDGLDYCQVATNVFTANKVVEVNVFCYPLSTEEKNTAVHGRWSESLY